MSADDVLKSIQDKGVKFVDLRFTDTRGKEMHMTLPTSMVDADFFEDGKMFDGSSIAGWKGIQESDMILMPDADSAILDPFTDEPTLNLRCDVIEPSTMQGYERDPRSIAKRAEAYLRSTGVADTAYFGPEPEFFIFDDVRWSSTSAGAMYRIDSEEAEWNSERVYEDGNMGHRPGPKGGFVRAKTMGGDIHVDAVDGWLQAVTMGGDIEAGLVGNGGDVLLSSNSGDIELCVPSGFGMELDLKIAFTRNSRKEYEIDAPGDLNENVSSEWDYDHGTPRKFLRQSGTVNGGGNTVKLSTINGDITVREGC